MSKAERAPMYVRFLKRPKYREKINRTSLHAEIFFLFSLSITLVSTSYHLVSFSRANYPQFFSHNKCQLDQPSFPEKRTMHKHSIIFSLCAFQNYCLSAIFSSDLKHFQSAVMESFATSAPQAPTTPLAFVNLNKRRRLLKWASFPTRAMQLIQTAAGSIAVQDERIHPFENENSDVQRNQCIKQEFLLYDLL